MRREWIYIAIVLLLAWYGWSERRSSSSEMVAEALAVQASVKPLALPAFASRVRAPAARASAKAARAEPNPFLDLNQCWARISEEIPPSADYAANVPLYLGGLVGSWFTEQNAVEHGPIEERSTAGKFMLALGRADLLLGKEIDRNEDEALKLLDEVSEEDPENSAPLMYMAVIEKRAGRDEAAEALLLRARTRSYFDTYSKTLFRALLREVQTDADFLAASAARATMPGPNVAPMKSLLASRDDSSLAMQMMHDGLQKANRIEGLDWISFEYTIGRWALENLGMGGEYPEGGRMVALKDDYWLKCYPGVVADIRKQVKVSLNGSSAVY